MFPTTRLSPCRPRAASRLALSLAGVLVTCCLATTARASSAAEFAYPESRVWTSAIRLVRLDLESPITEKDRDNGYFLFEFPHQGKLYSGSLEVVLVSQDKGPRVRVVVSVSQMPSYVERMVLSRLGRKLKQDFGPPGVGGRRDRDDEDRRKDDKPDERPDDGPPGGSDDNRSPAAPGQEPKEPAPE